MARGYASGPPVAAESFSLSIPAGQAYARFIGEKPLPGDEAAPLETGAAEGSISTTRSNIKHGAAAAYEGFPPADLAQKVVGATLAASQPAENDDPDPEVDGGAGGTAMEGEPIPGIDVKLGKNAGGAVAGTGPVRATPTDPGDPFPPDAPGEAPAAGDPIPGIDVIVKQHPPR